MDKEEQKRLQNNFKENYFKYIKPRLDFFEQERVKSFNLFRFILAPFIILLGLLLILFLNSIKSQNDYGYVFAVIFVDLVFVFISYVILQTKLANEVKENFMPVVCKCFENLQWQHGYDNRSDEFHKVKLLDYYNRSNFDDVFIGQRNGVNFQIIEAILSRESGTGDDKKVKKIFQGVILKIDSVKEFSGNTVIRMDSLFKFDKGNLRHTELEDVVFEKKYDVFTNDEVEARYLITTAFMERINNIEQIFSAKKVFCSFANNKVYIGLEVYYDMFTLCYLNKPLNQAEFFIKMFNEIISIYKLIDHFKLTQK